VPRDHRDHCGEPAHKRTRKKIAENFCGAAPEKCAKRPVAADDCAWETAEQWKSRRAKKDERRRDEHEQQMLRHVGEKRGVVERFERRADR
jgi:hypothetical protein